ncbi:MAG TPA: hypothetical protein DIC22_00665, partial [Chitinophagaceae bacterium]|nr:hypothetical protein [Chitinophagaceae bacterium]
MGKMPDRRNFSESGRTCESMQSVFVSVLGGGGAFFVNSIMSRFLFIALFCGILQNARTQTQYISFRIDSAVRAAVEARRIPGLQIAVVKYGLVLKKGHYGFANLEDRVPVTDSTMFPIAAMSRAMTCA